MKYTIDDFARLIDHTNLHADASNEDMKKLWSEEIPLQNGGYQSGSI